MHWDIAAAAKSFKKRNYRTANGKKLQSGLHLTKIDVNKDEAFAAIKKSVAESSEVWESQLISKYQNLKNVCNDNLPGLWDSLEFEISIQKILNIADCTLPFAGIVLGSPSSLKTVGIQLFRKWPNVFYTDSFSAKSMVSHSTAVKKEDLRLLPRRCMFGSVLPSIFHIRFTSIWER